MKRLDVYIFENKLAASREKAKRLVSEGKVSVNGKVTKKPSFSIADTDKVEIEEHENYVGRGAYKLLGAFESFELDVTGKVCADIGASTGGFTQVLLEKGAKLVWAVDVGHGQLDKTLLNDSRVKNCEGINVKDLPNDFFSPKPDFVCADLSFISLRAALPNVIEAVDDGTMFVTLIKPQFEAGRAALNKNGLVKNKKDHMNVLASLTSFFESEGLSPKGLVPSPICGGDGNIEYLCCTVKNGGESRSFDIKAVVDKAFETHGR